MKHVITALGTLWFVGVGLFTTESVTQMVASTALILASSLALAWLGDRWEIKD